MSSRAHHSAVDRLKWRIKSRIDADRERPRDVRLSQQGLADKIGIGKGTLSELLSGKSSTQGLLAHLDTIADYLGVPPAELIAPYDSQLMELRRDEYRLLRQWRAWPPDVRAKFLSIVEFFGQIWPEDLEARTWIHDLRRLGTDGRRNMRDALNAALLTQREKRAGRRQAQ